MASPTRKPTPHGGPVGREVATLDRIGQQLHRASFDAPSGEVWFGDDAAVLSEVPRGLQAVLCTDAAVAGVHCDLSLLSPSDLGWRATIATISDLAAMGAWPWRLVATVALPADMDINAVMEGVIAAATLYQCPVVGGDVSSSPNAVVSIAALGLVPLKTAVLRSGAQVGDIVALTGPVGGSAAGLEALRRGESASAVIERHRRPIARVTQGIAARLGGASAMIDISDGLSLDLHRLADASGVGFSLESIPLAQGATLRQGLGGGEDYELLITTSDFGSLCEAFSAEDLELPTAIGVIVADPSIRLIDGVDSQPLGWTHDVG